MEIEVWLDGLGFTSNESQSVARHLLEAAGLTNPRKHAMAASKLAAANKLLSEHIALVCGKHCRAVAQAEDAWRVFVACEPAQCSVCRGSNNRRATIMMTEACLRASVSRILVLGGSGGTLRELQSLLENTPIELRCVDGREESPNKKDALADLNWAQLMLIWASTPLPHKVSTSYTDECPRDLRMITVGRRGIEALCGEVVKSLRGG